MSEAGVDLMDEIPERLRYLLDGQIAILSTVGADGRPQVTPVWFLNDGGRIRFSINTARQKLKNLRRDPSCTVVLLDLAEPYRYVEIRGDAEIEADDGYVFADRVGAKYHADMRTYDRPGLSRVAITVRPVRVNAVDMG